MMRKIIAMVLALVIAAVVAAPQVNLKREIVKRTLGDKNDTAVTKGDVVWTGTQSGDFDKSANGYGWYRSYNRKVQVNHDPLTGEMVGSSYRQLGPTGSGTIGGMTGEWSGATLSSLTETIYSSSPYQGGATGNPGGRYPFTCEFINSYLFVIWNDFDLTTDGTTSQAMFAVCDVTFGWDFPFWSAPKRIESVEGSSTPPGAWSGVGDVAYNPEDGYYYWTTNWDDWTDPATPAGGEPVSRKIHIVTGRSQTPADADSWEWIDHNDYNLNIGSDYQVGVTEVAGDLQIAYAKDIYGNGNGKAVIIGMFKDDTQYMENEAGEPIDLQYFMRLGYMYTDNWGADWTTGDFKGNWKTPNNEGINLFPSDIDKLFPWYGKQLADTDTTSVPLNMSYFQWNTSAIVTENNIVHVLLRNMPASTESDFIYYADGDDFVAGYYDVVGELTETGINWVRATRIASWMGIAHPTDDWTDTDEWKYSNTHDMGIGYAGNGVVYATWIDRPYDRFTLNTFPDPNKKYICDAYFTYSPDDGRTWDIDKTDEFVDEDPELPSWYLHYAKNITNTRTLYDEGFQVATHGKNELGEMTVMAGVQYYDPDNPLPDPVNDYYDHQQFLRVFKIKGVGTGIETEEVSMVKDFDLYQNYPNPFNPATEIKFALQNDSDVKLSIFNTKGEMVANLKDEKMVKGVHAVNFDASSLNSGVYFYKLEVGGRAETKKMVLTK